MWSERVALEGVEFLSLALINIAARLYEERVSSHHFAQGKQEMLELSLLAYFDASVKWLH